MSNAHAVGLLAAVIVFVGIKLLLLWLLSQDRR